MIAGVACSAATRRECFESRACASMISSGRGSRRSDLVCTRALGEQAGLPCDTRAPPPLPHLMSGDTEAPAACAARRARQMRLTPSAPRVLLGAEEIAGLELLVRTARRATSVRICDERETDGRR